MSKMYPIHFGKQGEYELNESALKHILSGDTAIRPVNSQGVRTTEVVLSGGLHTWDGWENLLSHHTNMHIFLNTMLIDMTIGSSLENFRTELLP